MLEARQHVVFRFARNSTHASIKSHTFLHRRLGQKICIERRRCVRRIARGNAPTPIWGLTKSMLQRLIFLLFKTISCLITKCRVGRVNYCESCASKLNSGIDVSNSHVPRFFYRRRDSVYTDSRRRGWRLPARNKKEGSTTIPY